MNWPYHRNSIILTIHYAILITLAIFFLGRTMVEHFDSDKFLGSVVLPIAFGAILIMTLMFAIYGLARMSSRGKAQARGHEDGKGGPKVLIGRTGERTYLPDGRAPASQGPGCDGPGQSSDECIPLVFDWGHRMPPDPAGETGRLLYGETVTSIAHQKLSLIMIHMASTWMFIALLSSIILYHPGSDEALEPLWDTIVMAVSLFGLVPILAVIYASVLEIRRVRPYLIFENGMALYWSSPSYHYRFFPWSQIAYYRKRRGLISGPSILVGGLMCRAQLIEGLTDDGAMRHVKDHLVRTTLWSALTGPPYKLRH